MTLDTEIWYMFNGSVSSVADCLESILGAYRWNQVKRFQYSMVIELEFYIVAIYIIMLELAMTIEIKDEISKTWTILFIYALVILHQI